MSNEFMPFYIVAVYAVPAIANQGRSLQSVTALLRAVFSSCHPNNGIKELKAI